MRSTVRQSSTDTPLFSSTTMMMVLANLIPLLGVLFLDWQTFTVVVLYWAENVILGLFLVIKMMFVAPSFPEYVASKESPRHLDVPIPDPSLKLYNRAAKFFLIPFFCFHYGMFCVVHGVFVFFLFRSSHSLSIDFSSNLKALKDIDFGNHIWFGVLAIILYQAYELVAVYFMKGEYRKTTVDTLFRSPYGRIVVLHIAILFGASAVSLLGNSTILLVILIIGKIMLELTLQKKKAAKERADDLG